MTKFNTFTAASVALLSVSFLASSVVAADMDGVMMKDGKMMMMKDGKAVGPMDKEMAMAGCCTIMPDGTMKMKDGHMKEGQSMTTSQAPYLSCSSSRLFAKQKPSNLV